MISLIPKPGETLRKLQRTNQKIRTKRQRRVGRIVYPRLLQLEYQKKLLKVARITQKAIEEIIIPQLPYLYLGTGIIQSVPVVTNKMVLNKPHMDTPIAGMNKLGKDVIKRVSLFFPEIAMEQMAVEQAKKVGKFSATQLAKKIGKSLGVGLYIGEGHDSDKTQEIVKGFIAENVSLIKSIPEKTLENVEGWVYKSVTEGKRVETLQSELMERTNISESKAELIARDQTTKLYGALNEARQEALGIETYIWRTIGDGRVRETHAELDGEEFSWADPPVTNDAGETNHPGEDFQCRCTAEPVLPF